MTLLKTTLEPPLAFGTMASRWGSTLSQGAIRARAPATRRGRPGNQATGARSISDWASRWWSRATRGTAPKDPWFRCRSAGSSTQADAAGEPSASASGMGVFRSSVTDMGSFLEVALMLVR